MKKKIIISSCIIICIVLGALLFLLLKNNKSKIASTITLDINPSIELNLDKDDKVVSAKALNSDAKKIVDDNLVGKPLDKAVEKIAEKVIEEDLTDDNGVTIVLHTDGKIKSATVDETLKREFSKKNFHAEVIVVKTITKEDKKLAEKYNVSPAKAAYINSLDISADSKELITKPVSELKEIKDTKQYCESGYFLDHGRCLKEIGEEEPTIGNVCPDGYDDYNGTCYKSSPVIETDNLICDNEFILENGKCVNHEEKSKESIYECSTGELGKKGDYFVIGIKDAEKMVCVDKSTGKKPTLRCLTHSHIMINGSCYNGPAPTINGGCPNGDTLSGGGCYSKDDEDQWVCPSGNIYHKSQNSVPDLCPDTFTYTEPKITGYKCEEGYTLENDKCINTITVEPFNERTCADGYTIIDNSRCIKKDDIKPYEKGNVCKNFNSRMKNNKCIIYDEKEPIHD